MSSHALARDALMPRTAGGSGRGLGLSVLVHAGLLVALAFGVNWRSRTPEAQQAELWAAVPQAAAPRAIEPEPVVAEPKPVPPPVARPLPRVETPPEPLPDAQIAIEKARVERLRKEREAAERERRKLQAERLAADKLAAEKLAAERLRQQQAEAARKQQAAEERQAQQREADRRKNIERMLGQAGASGERGATGSALQSAGPSASYAGRIVARIRPNIVFADEVAGNPTAEVEVRAAADGTILGRRLVKSSGVTTYDNAVLRAIDKTEVLPRDVDGRVPASLLLVFRVRD
jgi:colicin import membrane protein